MLQRPYQRVAIFIDTQNMYHSAKHQYGARVNFPALVEAAAGNRQVVRSIAYVAKSKTGEEGAFFGALTSNGIELKVKDVQEFASGEKKADWDVGMAVDAMAISPRVDVVVLATGDGDFIPLMSYLQTHGVLCEVVAFGPSTNSQLREQANRFIDLAENPGKFLLHGARHAATPHFPREASRAPAASVAPRSVPAAPVKREVVPARADQVPAQSRVTSPAAENTQAKPAPKKRGRKKASDVSETATSETKTKSGRNIRITF